MLEETSLPRAILSADLRYFAVVGALHGRASKQQHWNEQGVLASNTSGQKLVIGGKANKRAAVRLLRGCAASRVAMSDIDTEDSDSDEDADDSGPRPGPSHGSRYKVSATPTVP